MIASHSQKEQRLSVETYFKHKINKIAKLDGHTFIESLWMDETCSYAYNKKDEKNLFWRCSIVCTVLQKFIFLGKSGSTILVLFSNDYDFAV